MSLLTKNQHAQHSMENALLASLNHALAEAIDLKLQTKQAHWNVKGMHFIALHGLFDTLAGALEEYADMIAERTVQLGGIAEGSLQAVSRHSKITAHAVTSHQGNHYLETLSAAFVHYTRSTKRLIDEATAQNDTVTADMFTEITRGLDKHKWFIQAHLSNQ